MPRYPSPLPCTGVFPPSPYGTPNSFRSGGYPRRPIAVLRLRIFLDLIEAPARAPSFPLCFFREYLIPFFSPADPKTARSPRQSSGSGRLPSPPLLRIVRRPVCGDASPRMLGTFLVKHIAPCRIVLCHLSFGCALPLATYQLLLQSLIQRDRHPAPALRTSTSS